MRVRIITASAGSGKTYRLAQLLDEEIGAGRVRPDAVVAVTFTNQAAAELVERARGRLLTSGRIREAHELLAARIGTVNAVCGSLVADFAFELGLSPDVRVLDEAAAELEFRRAIGRVVSSDLADKLERYRHIFDMDLDWRFEVRRVVEAARANGLDAEAVRRCGERSNEELDACLGPCTTDDLDALLANAMKQAVRAIEATDDDKQNTRNYVEGCRDAIRALDRRNLRWGEWPMLAKAGPSKKVGAHAVPVQQLAARHIEHPRLRSEMHDLIGHVFDVASHVLSAYQEHKRALGVMDFVDQELLALQLLRLPSVREALAGQIGLFLVDEFQDTSPLQLAIFLELAGLANESVWVGDPKQAIYGFRGTDPALMDAAIESLTNLTHDGELVETATAAVSGGNVETLGTSYRSRPNLVGLTNEIFARAFETQGIDPRRTRLTPHLTQEPENLGHIVEYWPLAGRNVNDRAAAAATGVRELIDGRPNVRGADGVARRATHSDVAILCRTNAQCREIAAALGELGIPAVVPRTGLLDTFEGLVIMSALALWADPGDAVAAAELARLIHYADNIDAFVAQVLAAPGRDAFATDATVQRILAAREASQDLAPLGALDAVLAASDVRRLCAEWGDAAQRLANVDALRAHAVVYIDRTRAAGQSATLVGLLGYLEELSSEGFWREPRSDSQALLAGENAVTICTWHAAKGLEWPITILYGLESMSTTKSWGVHVLSGNQEFDVRDPLAGRWIRFWPNPYTKSNSLGAMRTAVENTEGHSHLCRKALREALRVLYVGWTRARDRLVLAAASNKLLDGILKTLTEIDGSLISEPPSEERAVWPVQWAGTTVNVFVAPAAGSDPIAAERAPGEVTVGLAAIARAPLRVLPSEAEPVPCDIGEIVQLGPRMRVTGSPDMEFVGRAVHAFIAADRDGLTTDERVSLARDLIDGFGVAGSIDVSEVLSAASQFWSWCVARFPGARLHREWPLSHRLDSGSLVGGTADLLAVTASAFALIDHKTFPGGEEAALDRARGYSGQLVTYANAVAAALSRPCESLWVHFPVLGRVVEVRAHSVSRDLAP